jgi:hydrogenase maturation protease
VSGPAALAGTRPALVIGVGNPERGDDGAGREVARRLRGRLPAGTELVECDGSATRLLAAWEGRSRVIVVDAASGSQPGSLRRFDAARAPLPAGMLHTSTHSWGVHEAIELARRLRRLPAELVVFAIGGVAFAPGRGLSQAARRAVAEAERRVLGELAEVT